MTNPIGKLRVTITTDFEVKNLKHFSASTLEEAAENTRKWVDDGTIGVDELTDDTSTVTVEVIEAAAAPSDEGPPWLRWALVWPNGRITIDTTRSGSPDSVWQLGLGWPTEKEIEEAKAKGVRCMLVSIAPAA